MAQRRRPPVVSALAAGLAGALLLAGCSDDSGDEGQQRPLSPPATAPTASPTPSASSSPTASPTAAASPSREPLSRFEGDPAVQGLRAYLRAFATATNADAPRAPSLLRLATARQQRDIPRAFADDRGLYYPGPQPGAVLGVRVVSPTERTLSTCLLEDGWAQPRRGAAPTQSRRVAAVTVTMTRENGLWKVDGAETTTQVSCSGVRLVEERV